MSVSIQTSHMDLQSYYLSHDKNRKVVSRAISLVLSLNAFAKRVSDVSAHTKTKLSYHNHFHCLYLFCLIPSKCY